LAVGSLKFQKQKLFNVGKAKILKESARPLRVFGVRFIEVSEAKTL
jgi:hypothetical protein